MNSKERVNAAFKGQPVDRIPFMCQIAIEHYFKALKMNDWCDIWLNPDRFAWAQQKLCKQYGMDGVLINVYPSYKIWNGILKIERSKEFDLVTFADNSKGKFTARADEIYDWKLKENKPNAETFDYDSLSYPKTKEDHYDVLKAFDKDFIEEYSIHWEFQSPFDHLVDLFGISEAMMLTLTDPLNAKKVLDKALELEKDKATGLFQQPIKVDAIKISSPYVGQSFLSPESYKEFVVPYEKALLDHIHSIESQIPIYLHTCGSLNDRLEILLESGYQGVECLDPPPLGNVVLKNACERLHNRAFIKGNLDSVNLLGKASKEEIKKEVISCIELGKKHKAGYVLSTACSTAPIVKPEIMEFVSEIVKEYGRV